MKNVGTMYQDAGFVMSDNCEMYDGCQCNDCCMERNDGVPAPFKKLGDENDNGCHCQAGWMCPQCVDNNAARIAALESEVGRLNETVERMKCCETCERSSFHGGCGYVDVCYYGPAEMIENHWKERSE